MADIDTALVGAVLNALPLDKMILAPLMAMMQAQASSSKAYVDFILGVGLAADGTIKTAKITYTEPVVDNDGVVQSIKEHSLSFPLLAMVTHPIVNVESGIIDFECTVEQSFEAGTSTDAAGGFGASIGWGPFKVNVRGRVAHKTEQTRKTDTRAKYSIHVEARRGEMPEAMSRLMDMVVDASVRPMQDTDKKLPVAMVLPPDPDTPPK